MRSSDGEIGTGGAPSGRSTSYQDLDVWRVAMDLAQQAYEVTRAFPKEEQFGMTSQIRRSATSIPANIVEEYGRQSRGDFARFLRIAQGSVKELETHLLLASRVGLLENGAEGELLEMADRVGRMLRGLIRSVQEKPAG